MKKKKLLKKLIECKKELKRLKDEYSYTIERKRTMTPDERVEMLLVEAERATKAYKNGGGIMDCYVAQNSLFSQKYRDAVRQLEALMGTPSEVSKKWRDLSTT